MESQYSVSVIIPVHNTAPYLRRCIESVRNQTLKDIEIILVDNLSTDDSPSICDEYANIDSRVKVLHLDEAGLSIARNAVIHLLTNQHNFGYDKFINYFKDYGNEKK